MSATPTPAPTRKSIRRLQPRRNDSDGTLSSSASPPQATITSRGAIAAAVTARKTRAYDKPANVMDSPAMLREDLTAYGYTKEEIAVLESLEEPEMDSFAQVKHGSYASAQLARTSSLEAFYRKRESRRGAIVKKQNGSPPGLGKKAKKTQVPVGGSGSNWVLFDPNRGLPPTLQTPQPDAYEKYSKYKPGNRKVLAYNTESCSMALRRVPASFEDREVHYLKEGPQLVMAPRRDSILID